MPKYKLRANAWPSQDFSNLLKSKDTNRDMTLKIPFNPIQTLQKKFIPIRSLPTRSISFSFDWTHLLNNDFLDHLSSTHNFHNVSRLKFYETDIISSNHTFSFLCGHVQKKKKITKWKYIYVSLPVVLYLIIHFFNSFILK
jgi:hypothetical protein